MVAIDVVVLGVADVTVEVCHCCDKPKRYHCCNSVVTAAACVGNTVAFDNVTAINTINFELSSTLLLARHTLFLKFFLYF